MIATGGEACPLPLTIDVQAELFPEVMHTRTGRRLHRSLNAGRYRTSCVISRGQNEK